jgi:hypothetical protein
MLEQVADVPVRAQRGVVLLVVADQWDAAFGLLEGPVVQVAGHRTDLPEPRILRSKC